MNDFVKGSYFLDGPTKQVALLVEPCEMKSWFSAAFMSSPKWILLRLSAFA